MSSLSLSLFEQSGSGDVTMPLIACKVPKREAGLSVGELAVVDFYDAFEAK
jgi:hypothetical protein